MTTKNTKGGTKLEAKKKIFDDDEKNNNEKNVALSINKAFAKKYEERKVKEEYTKVQKELKEREDESDDSSSEEEDEDGVLLTPSFEKSFLEVLPLIKSKDKRIYDPNINFFPSYTQLISEKEALHAETAPKHKPMYIKDAIRNEILEKMENGSDNDNDNDDDDENEEEERVEVDRNELLSREEELKLLKNSILSKFNDDGNKMEEEDEEDGDDDFLVIKKRSASEKKEEDDQQSQWEALRKAHEMSKLGGEKGKDGKMDVQMFWSKTSDPSDLFLRDFILNEKWMEKEKGLPSYDALVGDDEDLDVIEKQEEFEKTYNFRYEAPESNEVVSHPREIADSARRKSDKRKKKREARKAKKALEKIKKGEVLARLKNQKKAQLRESLLAVSGISSAPSEAEISRVVDDFDAAFDPDQHDRYMQQLFNDDYYNNDDGDEEHPVFDDDDDFELPPSKKYRGGDDDDEGDDNDDNGGDDEEESKLLGNATKSKLFAKKRDDLLSSTAEESNNNRDKLDQLLEEYYNLDFEDIVGDTPFRFPYRKIPKNDYGISVEEILETDEKDLNRYVSVKKLAPYRSSDPSPSVSWKKYKSKLMWEKKSQNNNNNNSSNRSNINASSDKKKKNSTKGISNINSEVSTSDSTDKSKVKVNIENNNSDIKTTKKRKRTRKNKK